MDSLIATSEQISADWLAAVLHLDAVTDVKVTPIGTGQMSHSRRVDYRTGSGAGRVVVKLAATEPTSRATGVGLGAYSREVAFYRELAERAAGLVPHHHLAEYDEQDGWFTLVLEDLHPAQVGDQIAGCSEQTARQALTALAQVQAPVLGDDVLGAAGWLNQPNPLTQSLYAQLLPALSDRYADRIDPRHRDVLERFADGVDAWLADRRAPLGLVHGDFRLDNLLFSADRCTIVDWQTVGWGPVMRDASYFLGGSLSVEDRRRHEERLVRDYHRALTAHGAHGLDWEHCWQEYRRQSFFGVLMAVIAPMIVQRTDRGDDMFVTLLARHSQHVLDTGALELLPGLHTDR